MLELGSRWCSELWFDRRDMLPSVGGARSIFFRLYCEDIYELKFAPLAAVEFPEFIAFCDDFF